MPTGKKNGAASTGKRGKEAQGSASPGKDRRNGYQVISTATYFRTERRGVNNFVASRARPGADDTVDVLKRADDDHSASGVAEIDAAFDETEPGS